MTGEVIKSFLVGLGFEVDDSSLAKFNKAIATAGARVVGLTSAIVATSTAVVVGISKISESFEQMGYEFRLIAPAINKTLLLRQALLQAYSAAGVNIYKVIQQSIRLNLSLTKTKFAFQALYQGVAAKFFPLLTKQSELFRQKLYANMPKIQLALERFVKFVFKALEVVTTLGERVWSILMRVYDFFKKLHDATDGWSTIILGVIAAWKLLNLAFLATPLGMILAGLVAILALYDDFMTFKEGGKSFFNWSNAIPSIEAAIKVLEGLWDILVAVFNVATSIFDVFGSLLSGDLEGAFEGLGTIFTNITAVIGRLIDHMKNLGSFGLAALTGLKNLFGGGLDAAGNVAANIQNNPATGGPNAPVSPLGAQGAQNVTTHQQVQQQTNINVTGAADAQATGRAVAGEQGRVNFNLARNLGSAAK